MCGAQTWSALVEAGQTLGDRFLYHRTPMLRGDDVAELQRRLSALGFDTGRVDGIFGPRTAGGLAEFQRNLGLPVDGILGATTLRELRRVTPRGGELDLVGEVRDREQLRQFPHTLLERNVAVGEEGGMDALVAALRRELVRAGAHVVPILHPQGSTHAALANAAQADVYVGFRLVPHEARCTVAFYEGYSYSSPGGRRLAGLAHGELAAALGFPPGAVEGMALPVLRETRMPAILCDIGPAASVVRGNATLARAVARALSAWVASPVG